MPHSERDPGPGKRSIYEEPSTPFSKPRDAAITWQNLLDALAFAAEITLARARRIGVQITWIDAMSDGDFGCMFSFGGPVIGGRLKHLHTLDDVPINFVRDKLMCWIAQAWKR